MAEPDRMVSPAAARGSGHATANRPPELSSGTAPQGPKASGTNANGTNANGTNANGTEPKPGPETDDWWESLEDDATGVPAERARVGQSEGPAAHTVAAAADVAPGTPDRPSGTRAAQPPLRAAPGPPGPSQTSPPRAPKGRKAAPSRRKLAKARRRAAKGKTPRSQRTPRWRGRILPKTVIGISMLLVAVGMGAAASGIGLYMYYQYRLETSDALIKSFNARYERAVENLQAEATNARAQIQTELEPLRKIAATGETLTVLLNQVQPSVWAVRTFDTAGQPVIGSAFAVASDSEKSFFLTSYSVIAAATAQPGPKVVLRKGDVELEATLWTWQEERDIALLIVSQGKIPRLEWAAADANRLGDRVFAVSGLGTAGAAITQGFLADVSATAVQHDAQVGTAFQGGPVIDSDGKVVAVASRGYAPLGFSSEGVFFAPPVRVACEKVLNCPNGIVSGAGAQR